MGELPEPRFLDGAKGRYLGTYVPARGPVKGAFVYLPPFAEEMNRCRAMVMEQATRMSRLGMACLLVDPYGTGDSEGDLVSATWEGWVEDTLAAADWLRERSGASGVSLWGLRLGSLLAADACSRRPDAVDRLLLWQPVVDGRMFVTQYLRMRVAYLVDRGLPQETTDDMRKRLEAGDVVEVSGYELGGPLMGEIDQRKLAPLLTKPGLPIDWFEHVPETGRDPSPGSRKAIAACTEQGCVVNTTTFCGPPLWQLHKRDTLPELVDKTSHQLETGA